MRVLLYAEYGPTIGAGHLMRSMALASAFCTMGAEAALCAPCQEAASVVQGRGLRYAGTVADDADGSEGLVSMLEGRLSLSSYDMLVIDSYKVSNTDLRALNAICPVAYFDDMQASCLPVSCVINGNITCDLAGYERRYAHSGVELLLGSGYCVLRDEFSEEREALPLAERKRVLLMTGGSDPHDASYEISSRLLRLDMLGDMELHVVAGSLNPNASRLRELAAGDSRLHVAVDVRRVSDIMSTCRCSISAGGTTLNELCAMGVPALAFSLAENQDHCVEVFASKGAVLSLGRFGDSSFYSLLESTLPRLLDDDQLLNAMSEKGRLLFDGLGARRVAERLGARFATATER